MNLTDDFREEIIETGGMIYSQIFPIEEEISRMRFYIKTMEEIIEEQEINEISKLEIGTEHMSEDQKLAYWTWNYPIYWDEIFKCNVRSLFLVTIISYTESKLKVICKDVEIILRSNIKSSDLKGGIFERSRKYLECFSKFTNPSKEVWDLINCIYEVRNILVHNNGFIHDSRKSAKYIRQFINKRSDISETNDLIKLEASFCFFALETVSLFLTSLREEVQRLCNNVKTLE